MVLCLAGRKVFAARALLREPTISSSGRSGAVVCILGWNCAADPDLVLSLLHCAALCCAVSCLQLRELLRLAPRNRQTMLFSATFNDDVQQLAGECCHSWWLLACT